MKRLATNPETDFRELPGLKERGIRAADEMWDAVASIHKTPSQAYENGRVARVPASVSRRPSDLRILDKPVLRMGGYGSGVRGATHWAIPRDRLAEFISAVARLAPQLCGKPRGPVGDLPPRRKKNEDDESEGC